MKKILISFLILAFLIPALVWADDELKPVLISVEGQPATVSVNGTVLEKISTPDQIRFFKVMKKEGNTLYGIRVKVEEKVKEAVKNAGETSGVTVQGTIADLEKIAGPWDVKLFEKIRQVGSALWGYRKQEKEHLGIDKLGSEVITCIKTAIDKKDTSIKKTIVVASDELTTAVDTRNFCQKAALDLSTNQERMKAWKICKDNFQKAVKESRQTAKKYRDEIWKVYKQEVKACYKSDVVSAVPNSSGPVACTLDAKVCDDGSAVGRTGPNCEFASCPGEEAEDKVDSSSNVIRDDEDNILLEDGGDMLDL